MLETKAIIYCKNTYAARVKLLIVISIRLVNKDETDLVELFAFYFTLVLY